MSRLEALVKFLAQMEKGALFELRTPDTFLKLSKYATNQVSRMPSRRAHRYFTKLVLGKPYDMVHRFIDEPYIIYGKEHRRFFHTYIDAFLGGVVTSSDPKAGLAGVTHVWLDEKCSNDRQFKQFIESLARADEAWSRLLKKGKKRRKKARYF